MRKRNRGEDAAVHFETLEPRLLLAGNVLVQVIGGDLVITGDALGNEITIEQTGDGEYEINGLASTTVNSGASVTAAGVNGDFRINTLGGDDDVDIIGHTEVPGDIEADMGDDSNRFRIQDSTIVRGGLSVESGSGDDRVQFWNSARVVGSVDISSGGGADDIEIWNDTALDGKVTIETGAGADGVDFRNDVVLGNKVSIDTGADADVVVIRNRAHISGKLDIHTGDGADTVSIDGSDTGVRVDGKTSISTDSDAAADTVTVLDTAFGSDLKIDTGGGGDTVEMDDLTVARKVDIRTDGDEPDGDTVDIGRIGGNGGLTTDDLKIRTGSGVDTVTIANSTIGKKAKVSTDDGDDTFDLFDNTFNGKLKVTMGSGDDTLTTNTGGNFVATKTQFDGGNDADTLTTSPSNWFNAEQRKNFETIRHYIA